jgi:membrane protease subunit (stomatin/prohibitin family)
MHGGDNTFPCEVYFINTTLQPECTWGTKAPAAIKDPETQLIVHIRAFGSYVIRIGDPQFLLNCLVGFVNGGEFVSYTKLIDKLDGIIQQTVQQAIGDTISKNKVTVMELPSECENFSETMKEKCVPYFAKYGFEMTDFTTGSINFPDEDLEAYKKKSELEMLGTTYERNRGLDIQEKWAGNEGTAGGLATAGIGVAMGMNAVKGGAPFNPAADVSEAPKETTKTKCISCGKEIPIGCKFCPECGAKQTSVCPKCGKPLPPGVKFCPECGQPIAGGNNNEANK